MSRLRNEGVNGQLIMPDLVERPVPEALDEPSGITSPVSRPACDHDRVPSAVVRLGCWVSHVHAMQQASMMASEQLSTRLPSVLLHKYMPIRSRSA